MDRRMSDRANSDRDQMTLAEFMSRAHVELDAFEAATRAHLAENDQPDLTHTREEWWGQVATYFEWCEFEEATKGGGDRRGNRERRR